MEYQYPIPREVNSEVKFGRYLSLTGLMAGVLAMILASQLRTLVVPALQILFLIYCLGMTVLALLPCRSNPGRKYFSLVLILAAKKRITYHPIENPNFSEELEEYYAEAQRI